MPDEKKRDVRPSQPAEDQGAPIQKRDERGVLIEDEKRRQSVMQDDPTPFDTTPQTPKTGGEEEKAE